MNTDWLNWLLIPASYLIGSMPWGLLVVRATTKVDVRTTGSGKTGATNVLRAAGKWAALVVLLADFGKGLGVVLLARWIGDDSTLHAAAASAVIAGHDATYSAPLRSLGPGPPRRCGGRTRNATGWCRG